MSVNVGLVVRVFLTKKSQSNVCNVRLLLFSLCLGYQPHLIKGVAYAGLHMPPSDQFFLVVKVRLTTSKEASMSDDRVLQCKLLS